MVLLTVALSGSLIGSAAQPGSAAKTSSSAIVKSSAPAVSGKTGKSSGKDAAVDAGSLEKVHALFSTELKKYVTPAGVDYPAWKKDPKPLNDYLASLSKVTKDEYARLTPDEKLVFWINAYNAYTIKLVLENYPIKGTKEYYPVSSIRQIDGFWENNSIELAGKKVTLEGMEHDILRRDFQEPRTHFAVVCAAVGCGKLMNSAYSSGRVNDDLAKAATEFLSNPKNVKVDPEKKTIHVSQIFKWFPLDFANEVGLGKRFPPPTDDEIVAAYVLTKAPDTVRGKLGADDAKGFKVIYDEYDWSLNDSAKPPATP